jgi:hypothetical protein
MAKQYIRTLLPPSLKMDLFEFQGRTFQVASQQQAAEVEPSMPGAWPMAWSSATAPPVAASQRELQRNLTDETAEVRDMMLAMADDFSTNPREIKRLLNMVRFHLLLRVGRIAHLKAVPALQQYQRWILLSLRWPDMMRWLQWGADRLSPRETELEAGHVVSRLRRLEELAGRSDDVASWRAGAVAQLGLPDAGASWLDDPHLLAFFQRESKIEDATERLSGGAALGFY